MVPTVTVIVNIRQGRETNTQDQLLKMSSPSDMSEGAVCKMMLRSRKITPRLPKEPVTPGSDKHDTRSRRSSTKGQNHGRETSTNCTDPWEDSDDVILVGLTMPASRQTKSRRKRCDRDLEDELEDFVTAPQRRSVRVRFDLDDTPTKSTQFINEAYSPVKFFSSLTDDAFSSVTRSKKTEDQVFDSSHYFSHIPSEDNKENDVNICAFFKDLPPLSENQKFLKNEVAVKTRSSPENTLVLDLDETLVHCSVIPMANADYTFSADFLDGCYKIYMNVRPYVKEFLEKLSRIYEIFIFTTAKRDYAQKILDIVDPQKKIRHRLFQEDCICVKGHYIKDLSLLKRDLSKLVVVDTSVHKFAYHINNGIVIPGWLCDRKDKELLKLIPFLEKLTEEGDVRIRISRMYPFHKLLVED
ncbi:CTD small phosphatase-like protein 2-B isoform X2 [Protopterus annectens]|uniref:CTD small phosphatase-like protein 2-B isoform X2 n=1 Tax=Protopterus annectens TaxID=7888 RepID=UPI001CF9686B|nr:CTD small phosphatase-like protein 2-B isoform X2 [Protopterus annectens]